MNSRRESQNAEKWRVRIALLAMWAGLGGLGAFLWDVQIIEQHRYQSKIITQSIRRVRMPAWRGCLLDRNGAHLSDNRPSYGLSLYLEELRKPGRLARTVDHVDTLLDDLSTRIGLPREVTRTRIERHIHEQRMLPFTVWRDLDERAVARWAERIGTLPGVDLTTQTVRIYPFNDSAGHIVGHVGMGGMGSAGEEQQYDFYLDEMEGRSGLEKVFDEMLRGTPGGYWLQIDAFGFRREQMAVQPPGRGQDIQLTLDIRIQRAAEEALGNEPGAVCVIDARNGEVLAMATYPRLPLNEFVPRLSNTLFQSLNNDPNRPWINRPIQGVYAPGSTFKMVVAMAALSHGKATPDTAYFCPGHIELGGGLRMHCAHRSGHGSLTMREAIARSCNVYFFHLGMETGWDVIEGVAASLNIGERLGLELGPEIERAGLLPSKRWKREKLGFGWTEGDTCNASIGQGYLATTPMQMAVMTAALANGGWVVSPRLVRAVRPDPESPWQPVPLPAPRRLGWAPIDLEVIRLGMRDVIHTHYGTGRVARIPSVTYAAKTGTAQFGPPGHKKYHAWMVAFAPYDQPAYAISMVLDSADSAGLSAAPKTKLLMEKLFPAAVPTPPPPGGPL